MTTAAIHPFETSERRDLRANPQLHGGMGYMRESEVERQYRDMRILGIGGGINEIMTGLASKMLGYTS